MPRNVVLTIVILLSLLTTAPSGRVALLAKPVSILPKDCTLFAGEEIPLTLEGSVPSHAIVHWEASSGGIIAMLPERNALFVAPSQPAIVTISVSVSPAIPGLKTPLTRRCIITSPNNAPRDVALLTGMDTRLNT